MERSRVTRYLRIAVTALSLTACLLLVALWVRSYWRMDWASSWLTSNRFVKSFSYLGSIALEHTAAPRREADIHTVGWGSEMINQWDLEKENISPPKLWWKVRKYDSGTSVSVFVSHWILVLIAFVSAAVPWIGWSRRFSLRTLLIATTLVAVGLGVIVWAAK